MSFKPMRKPFFVVVLASKFEERSLQCVIDPLSNALTSLSGVQWLVVLLPHFLTLVSFNNSCSIHVASMVLISWFKEIKSRDAFENHNKWVHNLPNHVRDWLLDLLACSNPTFPTKDSLLPYAELSRTYSKMLGKASQLLRCIKSSGLLDNLLATINRDLESLSTDNAINLVSKVICLFLTC